MRFHPAPGSPFATGGAPYPHARADLDGDGRPDLIAPNIHGDSVAVLLNRSEAAKERTAGGPIGTSATAPAFVPAPGSPLSTATRPFFVATGRIDSGGTTDVAVTHDDLRIASLLLGDGQGRLAPAPASPLGLGGLGMEIVLADLDGDGHDDLLTPDLTGLRVFLGDGNGRFHPAPGSPWRIGGGVWAFTVADLDADGSLDVVLCAGDDDRRIVLLGRPPRAAERGRAGGP